MRNRRRRPLPPWLALTALGAAVLALGADGRAAAPPLPYPILFVTQVPVPADFATIGSVFANHLPQPQEVARGGDLWIRYPDGALRNLTREAGFGEAATFQGAAAIAVRDPAVHWNGTKAVFSMVIGSPTQQYVWGQYRWQLYEVTGLAKGQTAVVTKVAKQPPFDNVQPAYGSDGRIVFVSARPRGGEPHLHPQLDEYESTPTPTGLWSLDPASGDLRLLQHAPSGSFTPIVDSFGRVVFTRWDHLQRDQQADADALGEGDYGTFDYASEAAAAARLPRQEEVFPEPRSDRADLLAGTAMLGHEQNHFFPWMVNQDGSGEETLNHIGRHELHTYFEQSLGDDPNLVEFIAEVTGRTNPRPVFNLLQLREDPTEPGRYLGVDAPEFATHAAGLVAALSAPPGRRADAITVEYLTHPATAGFVGDGEPVPAGHSGHYRDPLPLSDGRVVAAHAAEPRRNANLGSRAAPLPNYRFRLRLLEPAGNGYLAAGEALTGGLSRTVSWYDPDVLVTYSGELWEMHPVEVRPRPVPPLTRAQLEAPELQVFAEEGVDPLAFSRWLDQRGLGLLVARNVTARDDADRQQPFNLRVPGGAQTIGAGGKVYDVTHLELFQGDQVRGMGGVAEPSAGRRVLARPLHDVPADAAAADGGGATTATVAADGSVAALVPARRALAWQLVGPAGAPVVRERNWITVQPGEVRTCDGCHGVNSANQAGAGAAVQPPQALRSVLRWWRDAAGAEPPANGWVRPPGLRSGFEVRVALISGAGERLATALPAGACLANTSCFAGAVPNQTEVMLRLVGPKPNGYLWPTLVRFTTSEVDVWIRRIASGEAKHYRLAPLAPGSGELDGLVDPAGFLP